jgi:hypothetical protein
MYSTESNREYFLSAANYFGNYGPPRFPRRLVLEGRVTMARQQPDSKFDPDVVSHWLAEYAARAQFESLREQQL